MNVLHHYPNEALPPRMPPCAPSFYRNEGQVVQWALQTVGMTPEQAEELRRQVTPMSPNPNASQKPRTIPTTKRLISNPYANSTPATPAIPSLISCHTYTHTHMHTCTHAHMHTCTHAHAHIHIYTHTRIHTYTHTHIQGITGVDLQQLTEAQVPLTRSFSRVPASALSVSVCASKFA